MREVKRESCGKLAPTEREAKARKVSSEACGFTQCVDLPEGRRRRSA